ncbi:hypothetical protein [Christiangramia sabulilitoris]|uniref:Calx-beta domain-containing protein n=1 Tax=Christiangramia sabulilitoris TaxID=2583991 RepID=A0A550I7U1_9FLAO|nr:hypothetical protein [Christiangramia sabulilitoris]TRO67040.1 hypothetical protein FGM01_03910 [Christiangramia sabulilitoris]
MKKIINKIPALLLLMVVLVSCEYEPIIFDNENGLTAVNFKASSGTLPVPAEGSTFEIPVTVTTVSTSDRTINYSVDESSTASPAEYSITEAVIPAGSYVGSIVVTGNFDAIPDLTTTTVVVNLEGVEGGDSVDTRNKFSLNLFKKCPSDLAGIYQVSSTGASTDAGTGFPTVDGFAYTVSIEKKEGSDLEYVISDGVAGVYIEWYSGYGYTFETEGEFIDVCDSLSGSWQDAFGSTIVLDGTVNEDGTLTINWTNGFGDSATATYTRQ